MPLSTSTSTSTSPSPREILSQPTWSVRSLLPPGPKSSSDPSTLPSSEIEDEINSQTLAHLLRLSALPQPSSPEEESQLLTTLRSQLHFVRSIQRVDTSGVTPLRAIRDETAEGLEEQTIGLETLREALSREDVVGHARRPRRRRGELVDANEVENWDVVGGASKIAGPYFVVRS
jgi:Asp-tRNA(Asn)/Glu-tRNA(Gln) amidotransferase C subunit